MRQVHAFLRIINRAEAVSTYNLILSYRLAVTAKEVPSLEEFLTLSLGQSNQESVQTFDEKTDKFLEEQALKRFAERQKQNVRPSN